MCENKKIILSHKTDTYFDINKHTIAININQAKPIPINIGIQIGAVTTSQLISNRLVTFPIANKIVNATDIMMKPCLDFMLTSFFVQY